MKITNRYNLPEALVKAVKSKREYYEFKENRIGATTLIDSPYRRMLTMQHYDEIEEDISSMLWAILGIAVHKVLDQFDNTTVKELKIEHKYIYNNTEYTIVCIGDMWNPVNKRLTDWKITSKYSMDKDKDEWTSQLNVNKYLFESIGLEVNSLEISAILRDFSKKDKIENKFPFVIPFVSREIKIIDKESVKLYIEERLKKHFVDDIQECTPEERWQVPNIWAVMKKGGSRAINGGLHYNEIEANEHLNRVGHDYFVQFRKGEDNRCVEYCSVNKFCDYYKRNYLNKDIPKLD